MWVQQETGREHRAKPKAVELLSHLGLEQTQKVVEQTQWLGPHITYKGELALPASESLAVLWAGSVMGGLCYLCDV